MRGRFIGAAFGDDISATCPDEPPHTYIAHKETQRITIE
jgi:hypothetical protein